MATKPHYPEFDTAALRRRQELLAQQVRLFPLRRPPKTVAGVDAAILGEQIVAAAVLYEFPSLVPREHACVVARAEIPYIPGLLSLREGPAMVAAIQGLAQIPECLIVDGQGLAHPKRFGLACHLGVELGIPALGCAKSRLIGTFAEPQPERGSRSALYDHDEIIGAVLRTRSGVKPVFVSAGHLMTLDDAVALVLQATSGYRLPEPQRAADRLAGECKRRIADRGSP